MLLKLKKVLKFNKDLPAQIIKMDKIKKKVEYFLDKYNLKSTEKPFLVAFSGGYDSMCLLNVLSELNLNLIAIHLNHNWRGKESKKEEENCKYYCDKKGIKFYSETLTEDIQKTETAAREARYKFFEKCTKLFNTDIVFTAHNANDNAETLFLNIVRGTGLRGISGMAPDSAAPYSDDGGTPVRLLRPLLGFSRKRIEGYVRTHSLAYREDRTNAMTDYRRNRIRHLVFPVFEQMNPSFIRTVSEEMSYFAQAEAVADSYFRSVEGTLSSRKGTDVVLSLERLMALEHWEYVLYRFLESYGFNRAAVASLSVGCCAKTIGRVVF